MALMMYLGYHVTGECTGGEVGWVYTISNLQLVIANNESVLFSTLEEKIKFLFL